MIDNCDSRLDSEMVLSWAKRKKGFELLGGKCTKCGDNNLIHMDFHHVDEKTSNMSKLWDKRWSRIEDELYKCILLKITTNDYTKI